MAHTDAVSASRAASKNLVDLRRRAGFRSQASFADHVVRTTGMPATRDVIAGIETRPDRRPALTVEEVFALALALNVSPTNLLLPHEDDGFVQLSPSVQVHAGVARGWIYGQTPLPVGAARDDFISKAPAYEQRSLRTDLERDIVASTSLTTDVRNAMLYLRGDRDHGLEEVGARGVAQLLRRSLASVTNRVNDMLEDLELEAQKEEQK